MPSSWPNCSGCGQAPDEPAAGRAGRADPAPPPLLTRRSRRAKHNLLASGHRRSGPRPACGRDLQQKYGRHRAEIRYHISGLPRRLERPNIAAATELREKFAEDLTAAAQILSPRWARRHDRGQSSRATAFADTFDVDVGRCFPPEEVARQAADNDAHVIKTRWPPAIHRELRCATRWRWAGPTS